MTVLSEISFTDHGGTDRSNRPGWGHRFLTIGGGGEVMETNGIADLLASLVIWS